MTTSQQLTDFHAYAENILASKGEEIALDEIFSLWWQEQYRDIDLEATLEAHAQYESGERGEDAFSELRASRAERNSGKTT
ncbi:MAG: hypothetical protein MI725_09055 [Pirellulales bacterium]|nr:hypothetical protein [Pirellulales bacterium]